MGTLTQDEAPRDPLHGELREEQGGSNSSVTPNERDSLLPRTEDETDNEHIVLVPDDLPTSAWILICLEFCERFAYFGILGPLQNYMQNTENGGLGLGQANASRLNFFFSLFSYSTSIVGAVVADQYLGRLRTILGAAVVYFIGLLALCASSLRVAQTKDSSIAGLVIALVLLGFGTGGIKPNVNPLMVEQYQGVSGTKRVTASGATVMVDRGLTIQRMNTIYYVALNIAALSPLATTELEHKYGIYSAFFLATAIFIVVFLTLLMLRGYIYSQQPNGSALPNAVRVLWIAIRHRSFDAAKSDASLVQGRVETSVWDDEFVDELSQTLAACRPFLLFPLFFMAWLQMNSNFISQARTMETHGLPNDILIELDPLTVIVLVPILEKVVYPWLRGRGIVLRPMFRITAGFFFISIAMAYTAFVQQLIYTSPPCYNSPRDKTCHGGTVPNHVHVAVQVPAYIFVALGEIFVAPTGYELAFTKAPKSMRSLIMALFMLTVAMGALLAILISPLSIDPKLTWMYGLLAVGTTCAGVIAWLSFRHMDNNGKS